MYGFQYSVVTDTSYDLESHISNVQPPFSSVRDIIPKNSVLKSSRTFVNCYTKCKEHRNYIFV